MKINGLDKDKIFSEYNELKNVADVAVKNNVCAVTVWKFMKQNGFVFKRQKLNKEKAEEMINEYKTGIPIEKIRHKYGLSASVVGDYIRRAGVGMNPTSTYRKNKVNEAFFEDITKEEVLWVLGWIYSDGNMHGSRLYWRIGLHPKDTEVLGKIKGAIKLEGNAYHIPKNKNLITLKVNSKKMCHDLLKLGVMPRKSLIIEYPTFFTEDWQHWAFLRGVLEGDGHISIRKNRLNFNCQIASGSNKFLEAIQKLWKEKLGIESTIYNPRGNSRNVCMNGDYNDKMKFLDKLYENAPQHLTLNRKRVIYEEMKRRQLNPPQWTDSDKGRYIPCHLKSKEGQIYHTNCVSKFSKEFNLTPGAVFDVMHGKRGHHTIKGFSIPTDEEIKSAETANAIIIKNY